MNRLERNWIRVFLVLMLAVSSHSLLRAQAPGKEIRGRVVNDEGQALPHASVLLVNESGNLRREATPDAQGFFQFSELVEGIYRLRRVTDAARKQRERGHKNVRPKGCRALHERPKAWSFATEPGANPSTSLGFIPARAHKRDLRRAS